MPNAHEYRDIIRNGVIVGRVAKTGTIADEVAAAHQLLKDKGLQSKTSRAQQMYEIACAFADTAAQLHKTGFRGGKQHHLAVVPFVVNSAFSIEVFLKTLAYVHCVEIGRVHELSDLYKILPEQVKLDISAALPDAASQHGLSADIDFSQILEGISDAFVKWRYIYERIDFATFGIPETIAAMMVLHRVCSAADRRPIEGEEA